MSNRVFPGLQTSKRLKMCAIVRSPDLWSQDTAGLSKQLSKVVWSRGDFCEIILSELLSEINQKVLATIGELEVRLPDLVIGIAERVLGQVSLDGSGVEQLVKSMIAEFSEEDEKLEVYLNPKDLELLKGLRRTEDVSEGEDSQKEEEEGFASAIAGIFDGLDGDDALLSEYPEVKFFEDDSLQSGDCQIKSRFGLLDGRIAPKLRKIEEELRGDD